MSAIIPTAHGFVEHRGHRVWFGVVGEGEDRGHLPILTVHGGPGLGHDYLEPLTKLAVGRRIIFYDQYGCGRSDKADYPVEYDVALFVDELDAVRRALGLGRLHLFAHSFGGVFALEYLLSARRTGIASLVLSNAFASMSGVVAGWARLFARLSPTAEKALTTAMEGGFVDPEIYQAALGEFIERFVLLGPLPEPMIRSQQMSGEEVYARMWGSSWFDPDGECARWDVTNRLHEITVPTLVVGGVRDQRVPELSEIIHAGISGSELAVLDTAHFPFFEEPETYLAMIRRYLERVEIG